MIRAVSWFCSEHHGCILPGGAAWQKPSPNASATAEMLALIDRPVKYYGRLTDDARALLGAASIALQAIDWTPSPALEIGIISAGFEGTLKANQNYFRDYVDSGRSIGRGNLFIYTLPTSALGEVAIALSLTGPCLFLELDLNPLSGLLHHAEELTGDGEAQGMLVLWSDSRAAVCVAVSGPAGVPGDFEFLKVVDQTPSQLLPQLQSMVP